MTDSDQLQQATESSGDNLASAAILMPGNLELEIIDNDGDVSEKEDDLQGSQDAVSNSDLPASPTTPVSNSAEPLQLTGPVENQFVRFQLIPISETPGRPAIGSVCERKLKVGETIKIGRQVVRDGQATIKGNKKATELDIWFTSKVVSRLHAEIWTKDGQVFVINVALCEGCG